MIGKRKKMMMQRDGKTKEKKYKTHVSRKADDHCNAKQNKPKKAHTQRTHKKY